MCIQQCIAITLVLTIALFIAAWHVRLEQYYLNQEEPNSEKLKIECTGSGSEKENSSAVDRDAAKDSSDSAAESYGPGKKKKKRQISDSEDNDEDFDPKKKEKKKKKIGMTAATTTTAMTSATTTTVSVGDEPPKKLSKRPVDESSKAVEQKSEKRPNDDRHKVDKDKERHSKKEKDRHRDKDKHRDETKREKDKSEKRKSVSAPVTPMKTDAQRKNPDELTFKLATSAAMTSTSSSSGVFSGDNSTEAIKKILNGDRVVAPSSSTSTSTSSSPMKVFKASDKPSPFKMSHALTSGAHVERVKLFPRSMPAESSSTPKPKKVVDFSGSNQGSAMDLLGSIMSDMNSAMKK